MKCRVACKGAEVEVNTKACVCMIHRWEFTIKVKDDLPRKTERPTFNVLGQFAGRDLCWIDIVTQQQTLELEFLLHQVMIRGSVKRCGISPSLKKKKKEDNFMQIAIVFFLISVFYVQSIEKLTS